MKKTISEKFVRRAIRGQQLIEQFYGIVQCPGQPFDATQGKQKIRRIKLWKIKKLKRKSYLMIARFAR